MSYEYVLVHKETRERGVVQVKTGGTWLSQDGWEGMTDKVFLFQSAGLYGGTPSQGVVCLSPDELEQFMQDHLEILPRYMQRWMAFCQPSQQ